MFYHFVCRTNLIRIRTTPNSRCISSFTVDYLVNSCGLSPESALKASKHIVINNSTSRPDSVISLFKSHGFTQNQISKLISGHPQLLLSSLDKTLKPKLEYFNNIGISGPNLGKLLSKDSSVLTSSLEKRTIPSINFLTSFYAFTPGDIAVILKRLKWSTVIQGRMEPNMAFLQDHGMPKSSISKLMTVNPRVLYVVPNKLNENVLELKKMGFNPSSKLFITALIVLSGLNKPLWVAKLDAYKSFGLSEDEVIYMFKKQPFVMAISVKKISSALDFLINNLRWARTDIIKYPSLLTLSLEKRIIPRSYVLQTLLSKGLISKTSIGRALTVAEDMFVESFVIKFENEVPELLKLYQSKLGIEESIYRSEDESEIGSL